MACIDTENTVGVVSFGKNRQVPSEGEIYTLYACPDYMGKGIEYALLHEALQR